MNRRIGLAPVVVLSGPICSGKSAFAGKLAERYGAKIIKTRDLILQHNPKVKEERGALQRAGERLDKADGGAWVRAALVRCIEQAQDRSSTTALYVIDSARIEGQVKAIRDAYGTAVHHIHLTAEEDELARRYENRVGHTKELASYSDVRKSKTERNVGRLSNLADIVVATDRCTENAVLIRATALLGLYPRSTEPLVDVLVGGQFGSEGKGNIVGYIAPEYDLLVRVGGPNAGHKVFAEPEPESYFHLPSGTERSADAHLLLGAGAVLNPTKLLQEIAHHQLSIDRLSIDPQAMIIENSDLEKEKKALQGISSTAQGVGWATARKIMGRGAKIRPSVRLARDIKELKPYIRDSQEVIQDAFLRRSKILLEGTQGTSLSIHHGTYPYVTSRDTTVAGCLADAGIAPTSVRRVIMVCRTYPIRVGGSSGHMELEISCEALAKRCGIPAEEIRKVERTTTTNRPRRIGEFDWEQLQRSVLLNGPTDIALTFVDYLSVNNRDAYRFEQLTDETLRFVEEVERVSGRPISLISTNFHWRNVIDRRAW